MMAQELDSLELGSEYNVPANASRNDTAPKLKLTLATVGMGVSVSGGARTLLHHDSL